MCVVQAVCSYRRNEKKLMKKRKQQENKKDKKIKLVQSKFYFMNHGKCHELVVTAPETVPKYRLKEIFDRTFVGKTEITDNPNIFSQYNGTYIVS